MGMLMHHTWLQQQEEQKKRKKTAKAVFRLNYSVTE